MMASRVGMSHLVTSARDREFKTKIVCQYASLLNSGSDPGDGPKGVVYSLLDVLLDEQGMAHERSAVEEGERFDIVDPAGSLIVSYEKDVHTLEIVLPEGYRVNGQGLENLSIRLGDLPIELPRAIASIKDYLVKSITREKKTL